MNEARTLPPAPLSTASNYARALRKIGAADYDAGSMRQCVIKEAALMLERQQMEIERLHRLVNTPLTAPFLDAVRYEAAHQVTRWAADDVQKTPDDWMRRLSILATKASSAFGRGDRSKGMHHIVSTAAACLNWHRVITSDHTAAHAAAQALAASAAQDAKAAAVAPHDAISDGDWLAIHHAAGDSAYDMARAFTSPLDPALSGRIVRYARAAFARGLTVGLGSFREVGHAVIKDGAIAAANDEPCTLDGKPSVPVFAHRESAA